MRHCVRRAVRLDKSGDSVRYPTYPFTFEEDEAAVRKKLDEDLKKNIDEFSSDKGSDEATKIETKFTHLFGRIDYMDGSDDKK